MKAYKLRADRAHYMNGYLSVDDIEQTIGDYFLLDQDYWADFWKPINVEFIDDSDGNNALYPPDITVWGTSNNLICNEKAYHILRGEMASYGEWLPLICEHIPYWLLHTTRKTGLDAVETKKSERSTNMLGDIEAKNIVFKDDAVKYMLIFLTEYNDYKNIYCTDSFKTLIEASELKGLVFSEDMSNSPF